MNSGSNLRSLEAQGPLQWSLIGLLALVTGCIPLLTRKFVSDDVIITSQVLACEILKVLFSASAIIASRSSLAGALHGWSLWRTVLTAGVPSATYAVQNTLLQISIRHLDSVTFSLLYQSRLISTAVCNYVFLKRSQTHRQILALCMVLSASFLVTLPAATGKDQPGDSKPFCGEGNSCSWWSIHSTVALGIAPVLLASLSSGLGSAYCQWVLQNQGHDPQVFSVELASTSIVLLLSSLLFQSSPDAQKVLTRGFFHGWTVLAVIPPVANAFAGILVGMVTKYAGGVSKGMGVIGGLVVAAILHRTVEDTEVPMRVWLSFPLVSLGMYLYMCPPRKSSFPHEKHE